MNFKYPPFFSAPFEIKITEHPPPYGNRQPVFKWTATRTATFLCSLDNQLFRSCGQGLTGQWTSRNIIPDGRHTFKLRGTDNRGNTVDITVDNWLIDTVPPTITFNDPPARTTSFPSISWQSTESAVFECSLDNGRYENCSSGRTGTWNGNDLRDGRHYLSVRGRDSAGNIGRIVTHQFDVGKFCL